MEERRKRKRLLRSASRRRRSLPEEKKKDDGDTTLYTVSLRTVFLGARAHAKRAYHRAVATRLVRRVILISAHDLIASLTSGNGERARERFVRVYGEKETREDEKREGEKGRGKDIERRRDVPLV